MKIVFDAMKLAWIAGVMVVNHGLVWSFTQSCTHNGRAVVLSVRVEVGVSVGDWCWMGKAR